MKSGISTPTGSAYAKAREITHTDNDWLKILDDPDWDKKIDHCIINNLPEAHTYRCWFEEVFCKNKIMRGFDDVPDVDTHVISFFHCEGKIFGIMCLEIPKEDATEDDDAPLCLILYGGGDLSKAVTFFNDENIERLVSIQPW